MSVKRALVASTVMAAMLLATACGGGGKSASQTENGEKGQPSAPDITKTPAELNFFTMAGDTDEVFNERFGNSIRKKFPNYKINYIRAQKGSTLPELLAAGTTIDIYYDSIGNFSEGLLVNRLEYDLSELIKKNSVDLNRFEPTVVDAMKQISGGKMYGLPVYMNNLALFYNKAVFDKFGVPYPKDGMTWDETLEIARKLNRTDGDKQYIGLAVSGSHMLRMNQFSLPYVDMQTDKPTIQNEKWRRLYQATIIDPAQDAGYKAKITELKNALPYRDALTKDQYLGMFVFLSQMPFTVPEMKTMNWEMVSLPTFKELPNVGSQSYPSYFTVTSLSKSKEAAMEVLKYLISDEYQMEISRKGTMPVLKNEAVQKAYAQDTEYKDKNFASVFYNKFAPISNKSIYDVAVEKTYTKDIGLIAKGEIDINTAFRNAEEAAVKAIAEAKNK
ncbi:ABC transporter substrate-binding protein [Paenibacillus oceani]|uniref:Extracellular solute-binding protein n=1 Tax=Paenibacillus oceani TaxID=2772510 RepID=A0A927C8G4_9BACL|nr:extracellular solute-binding protein [Paenibacillus oceani]MBD2861952.1 extracellular solute-binding protein [Paenibacillus oceani]